MSDEKLFATIAKIGIKLQSAAKLDEGVSLTAEEVKAFVTLSSQELISLAHKPKLADDEFPEVFGENEEFKPDIAPATEPTISPISPIEPVRHGKYKPLVNYLDGRTLKEITEKLQSLIESEKIEPFQMTEIKQLTDGTLYCIYWTTIEVK